MRTVIKCNELHTDTIVSSYLRRQLFLRVVKNMERQISKHNAEKILKECYLKAEETLKDEYKLESLFQGLEKKFGSLPVAGNVVRYIPLMASMVDLYAKKVYTEAPVGTILSIVSALVYIASPKELVPHFIPGIGKIDDVTVLVACLALVASDLDEYSKWREANGYLIDDLPEELTESERAEFFKRMMSAAKSQNE